MIPFCKILQTHFRNGLQFFFPFFFENKKLGILGRFCEKLGMTKKKLEKLGIAGELAYANKNTLKYPALNY